MKEKGLPLKTSKLLNEVVTSNYYSGKYYDLFIAHMQHPEKVRLSEEEKLIFERIERTKDTWLHHKKDSTVISIIKKEFGISPAQAYNYLADAKAMYALFVSFNPMAELMLRKERIDKAFELAESDPKGYGRLYGNALEALRQWELDMKAEIERQKPQEDKNIQFVYHMDFTQLGITPELMAEWKQRMQQLKFKARRNIGEDIADVSYE